MKISQLPVITEVDGAELILLVKNGANNTIEFGTIATILMNQYGVTTETYVNDELTRLLTNPATKVVVTTTEFAEALLTKADVNHDHNTVYALKTHTHNYADLQGKPEIPQISELEFANALNDLAEAQSTISTLEARITALEKIVAQHHPTI